jgi:protein tyrosine phosphatase (PTP) superfamily phosphohydrolase (DUF442 family)
MTWRCLHPLLLLSALMAVALPLRGSAAPTCEWQIDESQPGLHNFLRATTNVFSGSQPEGEAGFASLRQLGVKTIISVDGAKPDVALAAKHGMRYVHLPVGYDGIASNRVVELVKAGATLPGPIYVHCHHGKFRGPAAVAVICQANAGWTRDQALEFLHHAGTGAEYPGLYRAASDFTPPSPIQLNSVAGNFPSVVQPSTHVESMLAADHIFDRLEAAQRAGWKTPANHPDLVPAHEAMMLLEQFRELARLEGTAARSADYRAKLAAATSASEQLQSQLHMQGANADAAFKRVSESCTDCHRTYRNQ